MTLAVKPKTIKLLVLAASILGFMLRTVLYAAGVDGKGLLTAGYWADMGTWLLTAAVALVLFLWCRRLDGPKAYAKAYPASAFSAAGSILAGVAFALCGIPETQSEALSTAALALRFAAALSLVCVGFCRFTGRKPFFLFHCAVCLYLALRLVCQYRIWSVDPQIQNYCFYLGAHVALMLTAYQLAAFDTELGNHRALWGCGLASVYLCILALAGSRESFFLLCCAIWVWTNLSCLTLGKQPKSKENYNSTQEDSL